MQCKGFAAAFKAALGAAALAGVPAAAAELTLERGAADVPEVRVTGALAPGDDLAFITMVKPLAAATVVLTGPAEGPDTVLTGLNLGSVIAAQGYDTRLEAGRDCAAGCMLAWLGGAERALHPDARLAFVTGLDTTTETGAATRRLVEAFLDRVALPDGVTAADFADGPAADADWRAARAVAADGWGRLLPSAGAEIADDAGAPAADPADPAQADPADTAAVAGADDGDAGDAETPAAPDVPAPADGMPAADAGTATDGGTIAEGGAADGAGVAVLAQSEPAAPPAGESDPADIDDAAPTAGTGHDPVEGAEASDDAGAASEAGARNDGPAPQAPEPGTPSDTADSEISAGSVAMDEAQDEAAPEPLSLPDGQFWIVLESSRAVEALDPGAYEIAPQRFGLTTVRTRNGYFANVIGPFPEAEALATRARLQADGAIPRDAYLSQGLGFVERIN